MSGGKVMALTIQPITNRRLDEEICCTGVLTIKERFMHYLVHKTANTIS